MKGVFVSLLVLISAACFARPKADSNLIKASAIFQNLYTYYSAPNTVLLRETYPYDDKYTPDYLAANPGTVKPNEYAYLWPYSGTISAATVLFEVTKDRQYKQLLDEKILPGLEQYLDVKRKPAGYASYINTAKPSDRFYDDNIWLGIDFTDLYQLTREKKYLDKAKLIWAFVWSGHDEKLGGGIYWCEQRKTSKNTCSNAPAAVYALKLFQATKDSSYFVKGKELYNWTKKNLQDRTDFLYFDNISLKGKVDTRKYSYNSGQMLQAAVLLYNLTNDAAYLTEAEKVARASFNYFVHQQPNNGAVVFRDNNSWFNAVMLRGFAELQLAGGKNHYLHQFQSLLNDYYHSRRDEQGLFYRHTRQGQNRRMLLNQAGFVEMFGRLALMNKALK